MRKCTQKINMKSKSKKQQRTHTHRNGLVISILFVVSPMRYFIEVIPNNCTFYSLIILLSMNYCYACMFFFLECSTLLSLSLPVSLSLDVDKKAIFLFGWIISNVYNLIESECSRKKCVEKKRAGSLCSGNKYHNFSYSTYAFNTQYFWLDEICFLSTFFHIHVGIIHRVINITKSKIKCGNNCAVAFFINAMLKKEWKVHTQLTRRTHSTIQKHIENAITFTSFLTNNTCSEPNYRLPNVGM